MVEYLEAAASSAGEASAHADRAEGVVDTVRWDDDKLTVAGKTSPSLRGPKGDKGDPGGVRGVAIEGDNTEPKAIGELSVALGWGAEARGNNASSLGRNAETAGPGATAVGSGALASSTVATACGSRAQAKGYASSAWGPTAKAVGDYSISVGSNAKANAEWSIAIGPGHDIGTPAETHIGVPKGVTDRTGTPPSRVVLHGTAETTLEPTKPGHLVGKGYVDEVRALVETRAVVKQVSSPPTQHEPGVLYVIPE